MHVKGRSRSQMERAGDGRGRPGRRVKAKVLRGHEKINGLRFQGSPRRGILQLPCFALLCVFNRKDVGIKK